MKLIFTDKDGKTIPELPTIVSNELEMDNFISMLKDRKPITLTGHFPNDEDYEWLYKALFK